MKLYALKKIAAAMALWVAAAIPSPRGLCAEPVTDFSERSIPLMYGADGNPVAVVTVSVATYPEDLTYTKLKTQLGVARPELLKHSPEGLECLAEEYRTNPKPTAAEVERFVELYLPVYRAPQAHAASQDPGGSAWPSARPILKAQFANLVAIKSTSVVPDLGNPLSAVPFTDFMVPRSGQYGFVLPHGNSGNLAVGVFVSLIAELAPSSNWLAANGPPEKLATLSFPAVPFEEGSGAVPVRTQPAGGPGLSIGFRIESMRRGPFFTFLEHAISILASGNDDQIRSLFDRQTPEEVDMLFSTTNDRLELELLRQAMRKAHLGQAWIIEGKSTQYLLFSLDAPRTQQPTSTATPPSLPDQKPSVYAFRCSRSSNDILLTGQGSEVSTTVESVLNNGGGALLTPSDACRDLVRRQLNMQQQ